jgi:peptidoglycan/LPS O-acetylase OafA/YrhL
VTSSRTIPIATAQPEAFRFSENNFDLIRLVAALEVAVRHCYVHLVSEQLPAWLEYPLSLVPGVPIFFFLSGYLISRAWERSPSTSDYFRNRALRLFPALWACVALSVVILFASGYLATVQWSPLGIIAWIACQGTVVQFWNPGFLREFGTGAVNGSLWSISVEIQFYVATCVAYTLLRRLSPVRITIARAVLAAAFSLFNVCGGLIEEQLATLPRGELLQKAYKVTLLPWFFMFLLGAVAQRTSGPFVPALIQYHWSVVAMYVGALQLDFHAWGMPTGNDIPAYLVPLMGCMVLTAAYWRPGIAERLLRRNDISYGVYIHHMPLVNLLSYLGATGPAGSFWLALAGTLALATLSWRFVERPFLRRKRSALRTVSAPPAVP